MTTSTTDAEAIREALGVLRIKQEGWVATATIDDDSIDEAVRAILSYLASRREAQEPVAWRYRSSINGKFGKWTVQKNRPHWFKTGMPGVELEPLYTAPPPPAGEVERLRSALEQFEGRIKKYITQLKVTGQADVAHLLRRDVDCLRAALNGGRADE